MSSKANYIRFCETSEIGLFFKPFWLDTYTHPWDVIEAKVGEYFAFWVYHIETKFKFRFIRNPHLTPYTGLIICRDNTPIEIKLQLVEAMIHQLPSYHVMELDLSPELNFDLSSTLFQTSLKRTNLLALTNINQMFKQFKPALQRQIRKAIKSLHIVEKDDLELFYNLHSKTFLKHKKSPQIPFEVFADFWTASKENKCGKLYFILDDKENVHASIWLAFDETTAYYLAGGTDHSFYGSGAMSYLMWHVIQESAKMNLTTFDFEGSMLPTIDRFFKNFNPEEKQYLHLSHVKSKLYKLIKH